MRYLVPVLIMLGLIGLVVINAGGGRQGWKVGQSILLVLAALVLMAALFAFFVTKPSL
ncbi:MAG: hypothetical protein QOG16_1092 [Actinomycetota bacterium]|jgi:hypothetical protein|nr:hypothetical protein [Actinomycetota bacterium]